MQGLWIHTKRSNRDTDTIFCCTSNIPMKQVRCRTVISQEKYPNSALQNLCQNTISEKKETFPGGTSCQWSLTIFPLYLLASPFLLKLQHRQQRGCVTAAAGTARAVTSEPGKGLLGWSLNAEPKSLPILSCPAFVCRWARHHTTGTRLLCQSGWCNLCFAGSVKHGWGHDIHWQWSHETLVSFDLKLCVKQEGWADMLVLPRRNVPGLP